MHKLTMPGLDANTQSEEVWEEAGWERAMLQDVFAQNPLTRVGSEEALAGEGRGAGTGLEDEWVVEMRDLFSQSPLTRSSASEGEKGSEGPDG